MDAVFSSFMYQIRTPESWIALLDLRRRPCKISENEYNMFLEWIRAAGVLPAEALGTQRLTPATISAVVSMQTDNSGEIRVGAISRLRLPNCFVGSVQSIEPHDQIKLAPPPSSASGATLLQDVSNSTLVAELCRARLAARAEISIALDGSTVLLTECLMPLERLWPRNGLPDSIVVQTVPVDSNIQQFAVLNTTLIRD